MRGISREKQGTYRRFFVATPWETRGKNLQNPLKFKPRREKKVLSLVLCVAVMLSVMVLGAGAAFSDQADIENTEAVNMCSALNIIGGYEDGSFHPERNIKRSEVTKMICVALNGGKDPNLGTPVNPTFSDVRGTADGWAEKYIESCVAQGIVSGVGGGRFAPTGNVTGSQLAKMLLVSLGYNSDNEGFTGNAWETNVNVRASQKGLYAGLENMDVSAAVTRDQAAQMVWNALNAYEVEYKTTIVTDENGNLVTQVTVQDKQAIGNDGTPDRITLLGDKYEAKTFTGTFEGNSDNLNLKDGQIQVNGSIYDTGDLKKAAFTYDFDLSYIGEEVSVLFKDGTGGTKDQPDDKDTIYGVVVTGATTVYNITKNDLQDQKENGTVRFGDKNYDVAVVNETGYNYLNKNYGADTTAVVTKDVTTADNIADAITALKAVSADTIKLICNDNGDIVKAYVVESKLGRVTAVNSEKVSINATNVGTIVIEDNDVYDGIAKDDIVVTTTYYKAKATDTGAYTYVTKAEVVEGKIDGYNGTEKVTVDGTVYDIAGKTLSKAIDSDFTDTFVNQIGETVKLYTIGGIVYGAEMVTEATQYAVVEDATGSIGSTFDPLKAKIMKADGTEVTVEIHKDSIADAKSAKLDTGAVIKYSVVSDTEIKVTELNQATKPGAKEIYNKDTKKFNGSVASAEAVLFVNKTADPATTAVGDFYVYTIRSLDSIDLTANDYMASLSDDGKVVAAYVTQATKPGGASDETVYGIVSSENGTVKVDNDTYTSWTVQVDDNRDNDKTVLIAGDSAYLKEGYLVSFDVSSDNVYTTNDVTIYLKNANANINAQNVLAGVKEYDEAGQIVTYWTGGSDIGDASKATVSAVDDDVQIIFVDSEDNVAASVASYEYDQVKNAKNAYIVYDKGVNTNKVVAMFFDVDGDITK